MAAAQSPELWNGTFYGMTVEEVSRTIEGCVTSPKPESLLDGAAAKLTKPDLSIGERAYTARFFFSAADDRLQQVTLSPSKREGYQAMKPHIDLMLELLRERHGEEELLEMEQQGNLAATVKAIFVDAGRRITLVVVEIKDNPVIFNIVYQVLPDGHQRPT